MIEQKVGRTSVFYLRLQIMNPCKWQAQTEAVRSSISLGTIHWLKVAACFRVTSNGGGWKVVRKVGMERQEGNENASLKKRVAIYSDARLERQAFTLEKFARKCSPRCLYRATIFFVQENF